MQSPTGDPIPNAHEGMVESPLTDIGLNVLRRERDSLKRANLDLENAIAAHERIQAGLRGELDAANTRTEEQRAAKQALVAQYDLLRSGVAERVEAALKEIPPNLHARLEKLVGRLEDTLYHGLDGEGPTVNATAPHITVPQLLERIGSLIAASMPPNPNVMAELVHLVGVALGVPGKTLT